jgi:hypothetical protein
VGLRPWLQLLCLALCAGLTQREGAAVLQACVLLNVLLSLRTLVLAVEPQRT